MSSRRSRGFLLPLALVFLFILVLLQVGLIGLGQSAEFLVAKENERTADLLAGESVTAALGQELSGSNAPGVDLQDGFSATAPGESTKMKVDWGGGSNSLYQAPPKRWATFDNLFSDRTGLPEASFDPAAAKGALDNVQVAPGNTAVALRSSHGARQLVAFSSGFPYGAYAPQGSIQLDALKGWGNPSLSQTADDSFQKNPYAYFSGIPVDVRAKGAIRVIEAYPHGTARSEQGPVQLPSGAKAASDGTGALGLTGPLPKDQWCARIQSQVDDAYDRISSGVLDKTVYFDGPAFSKDAFATLLKSGGFGNFLQQFLSVGQACNVPFFPYPGMQDDSPFLIVFFLWHPYPVDFSGAGFSPSDSQQIATLGQQVKADQDQVSKLQQQESQLDPKSPGYSDQKALLDGQIAQYNSDIQALQGQARTLAAQQQQNSNLANQLSQAAVPQTATDDAHQLTSGWSYLFVIGKLFDIVSGLISGSDPFESFFVPCRVVHLGNGDPGFQFSGSTITMLATLTVPRGRTLRFSKDLIVQGDVWIQRGATLHLQGSDLTVQRPPSWVDFDSVPVSAQDDFSFPQGRIMLEQGATLLVDGNLTVTGGSYETGSVMVGSQIGPVQAIDQAILVKGDVNLTFGVLPAIALDDLVLGMAQGNSALSGLATDFLDPLVDDVAPNAAKLPYVGPWQWRDPWFAEYATTFEFFPWLEEWDLGGPWPIPLPYPNCERPIFQYISYLYSALLNLTTGENLYTQSPFWIFGRGLAPVFLKVDPKLVDDAFTGLEWGKLSWKDFEGVASDFLTNQLPNFAVGVVQEAITAIMKQLLLDLVPFDPVTCTTDPPEPEVKETAASFLEDEVGKFGDRLVEAVETMAQTMENEVYTDIGNELAKNNIYRELPGVLVYSGGKLTIGSAALATGFFFANGDVSIGAYRTVGVVASATGDIQAGTLYHYPYFAAASLFNPAKESDIWKAGLQFEVPDPGGNAANDVGVPTYRITAEGWLP